MIRNENGINFDVGYPLSNKDVFIKVGNLVAELIPLIKKIILRIEDKNGRRFFIYAEGIDKFKYNEAAYHTVQGILDFMADYKTLYEVNFVHLFFGNNKWRMSDAMILHNAGKQEVEAVLKKRATAIRRDSQ